MTSAWTTEWAIIANNVRYSCLYVQFSRLPFCMHFLQAAYLVNLLFLEMLITIRSLLTVINPSRSCKAPKQTAFNPMLIKLAAFGRMTGYLVASTKCKWLEMSQVVLAQNSKYQTLEKVRFTVRKTIKLSRMSDSFDWCIWGNLVGNVDSIRFLKNHKKVWFTFRVKRKT